MYYTELFHVGKHAFKNGLFILWLSVLVISVDFEFFTSFIIFLMKFVASCISYRLINILRYKRQLSSFIVLQILAIGNIWLVVLEYHFL